MASSADLNINIVLNGVNKTNRALKTVDTSVKKTTTSLVNQGKVLGNAQKGFAGATNASINFNRVISDMPYGIQGVANNLEMALFSFRGVTAGVDGFTNKLKALGTVMFTGSGAILTAITVIPTALIMLQKHFRKTKKEVEETTDSFDKFRDSLNSLSKFNATDNLDLLGESESRAQLDNLKRFQTQLKAVQVLKDRASNSRIVSNDELKNITKDLPEGFEGLITLAQNNRLSQEALNAVLEKNYGGIFLTDVKNVNEEVEKLNTSLESQLSIIKLYGQNVDDFRQLQEQVKAFKVNVDAVGNPIVKLADQLTVIQSMRDAFSVKASSDGFLSSTELKVLELYDSVLSKISSKLKEIQKPFVEPILNSDVTEDDITSSDLNVDLPFGKINQMITAEQLAIAQGIRNTLDGIAMGFLDGVVGAQNFGDAFKNMGNAIVQSLKQITAQLIVIRALGAIGGLIGGSVGSFISASVGSRRIGTNPSALNPNAFKTSAVNVGGTFKIQGSDLVKVIDNTNKRTLR